MASPVASTSTVPSSKQRRRRPGTLRAAAVACFCVCLLVPAVDAGSSSSSARNSAHRRAAHSLVSPAPNLRMDAKRSTASSALTQTTSLVLNPSVLASSASAALPPSASGSASSSSNASAITDPTVLDPNWQFPSAFDTVLGTNFTSPTCPGFFSTFLNSPSFQQCKPFSLLLSTSDAFFQIEKNSTSILNYVLEQTCSVPPSCNGTMAAYAARIQESDVCKDDLAEGNALATTALNGFLSYPMMAQAACSKNAATGDYCLTDATISTDASAMYWFLLGIGTPLPSDTTPSCGPCNKNLMQIYSRYASNSTLEISKTYAAAESIANNMCGPTFAPLAAHVTSSATHLHTSYFLLVLALLAASILL